MCFFGISVGKPKNPRKTKKSKSLGPLTEVLDFWIFGSLSLRANTARSMQLYVLVLVLVFILIFVLFLISVIVIGLTLVVLILVLLLFEQ